MQISKRNARKVLKISNFHWRGNFPFSSCSIFFAVQIVSTNNNNRNTHKNLKAETIKKRISHQKKKKKPGENGTRPLLKDSGVHKNGASTNRKKPAIHTRVGSSWLEFSLGLRCNQKWVLMCSCRNSVPKKIPKMPNLGILGQVWVMP